MKGPESFRYKAVNYIMHAKLKTKTFHSFSFDWNHGCSTIFANSKHFVILLILQLLRQKWCNFQREEKQNQEIDFRLLSQDSQKDSKATLEKEGSLYTHSTRLSSPRGWDTSTGFRPVISSKSTTPKEYTSDFSVNLPLEAYSGATYLHEGGNQVNTAVFSETVKNKREVWRHISECSPKSSHDTRGNMCICIKS